jgi:hypothetical protein
LELPVQSKNPKTPSIAGQPCVETFLSVAALSARITIFARDYSEQLTLRADNGKAAGLEAHHQLQNSG